MKTVLLAGGVLLAGSVGAGVVAMQRPSAPDVVRVGQAANRPNPDDSLREYKAAAAYRVRQVGVLPQGAQLDQVGHIEQKLRDGRKVVSGDLHYAIGDSERLHVWQTDIPHAVLAAELKPVLRGTSVLIGGQVWYYETTKDFPGVQQRQILSAELGDGVVVSVDAPLSMSRETFEAAVQSLA